MQQRLESTRWASRSPGRCARILNLPIRTNGICTTQHSSWRMTHDLPKDFDIQTDHIISARNQTLKNKKKKNRT